MNLIRRTIEETYPLAHFAYSTFRSANDMKRDFVKMAQYLEENSILRDILLDDNSIYRKEGQIKISNAAGMNKNAEIPSNVLEVLGFDRNVIGTVTGEPNKGNDEPTIWIHPRLKSMRNNEGLPGPGPEKVLGNLHRYEQVLPITLNLMATPGSKDPKGDVKKTLDTLLPFKKIDRVTLNISCPNTQHTIEENREMSYGLLEVINEHVDDQRVGVKISPDLRRYELAEQVSIVSNLVSYIEATNTTKKHEGELGIGGVSDQKLFERSFMMISDLNDLLKGKYSSKKIKIIGVGGIDNKEKANFYRENFDVKEIQVYSPFVRLGPKLLRKLR